MNSNIYQNYLRNLISTWRSQICKYWREKVIRTRFGAGLSALLQRNGSLYKHVIVLLYKHLSSTKGISVKVYKLIGTITKQCLFLLLSEIFGLITLDLSKFLSQLIRVKSLLYICDAVRHFNILPKLKSRKNRSFGNFLSSLFASLMQIVHADKATRGLNPQNFNSYYFVTYVSKTTWQNIY